MFILIYLLIGLMVSIIIVQDKSTEDDVNNMSYRYKMSAVSIKIIWTITWITLWPVVVFGGIIYVIMELKKGE